MYASQPPGPAAPVRRPCCARPARVVRTSHTRRLHACCRCRAGRAREQGGRQQAAAHRMEDGVKDRLWPPPSAQLRLCRHGRALPRPVGAAAGRAGTHMRRGAGRLRRAPRCPRPAPLPRRPRASADRGAAPVDGRGRDWSRERGHSERGELWREHTATNTCCSQLLTADTERAAKRNTDATRPRDAVRGDSAVSWP